MEYRGELSFQQSENLATRLGKDAQEREFEELELQSAGVGSQAAKRMRTMDDNRLFRDENLLLDTAKYLGTGAYGSVYEVSHTKIGAVVLKQFNEACPPTLPFKELDIMKFAKHPRVCSVIGAFLSGLPTIVLETCFGSLDRFKDRVRIPDIARILFQVSEGLAHLHSLNIIHCDIKPANILVKASNNIAITDFGSALLLNDKDWIKVSHACGTTSYCNYDAIVYNTYSYRTDMWGLLCIGYLLHCREPLIPRPKRGVDSKFHYPDVMVNGYKMPDGSYLPLVTRVSKVPTFGALLKTICKPNSYTSKEFIECTEMTALLKELKMTRDNINQVTRKFAEVPSTIPVAERNSYQTKDKKDPIKHTQFRRFYYESDTAVGVRPDELTGSHEQSKDCPDLIPNRDKPHSSNNRPASSPSLQPGLQAEQGPRARADEGGPHSVELVAELPQNAKTAQAENCKQMVRSPDVKPGCVLCCLKCRRYFSLHVSDMERHALKCLQK